MTAGPLGRFFRKVRPVATPQRQRAAAPPPTAENEETPDAERSKCVTHAASATAATAADTVVVNTRSEKARKARKRKADNADNADKADKADKAEAAAAEAAETPCPCPKQRKKLVGMGLAGFLFVTCVLDTFKWPCANIALAMYREPAAFADKPIADEMRDALPEFSLTTGFSGIDTPGVALNMIVSELTRRFPVK